MQFCQTHWNTLREKIAELGMTVLVSEGGEEAAKKVVSEINEGLTIDNFDPLMRAHWAIISNVMDILSSVGVNPMYLMSSGPEDLVEGYGVKYMGKTWPRCPLCYINLAHEVSCTDILCKLPKKTGYDWMLDKAADEQLEVWKSLKP